MKGPDPDLRIQPLSERFHLPAPAVRQLETLVRLLVEDPLAPTSVREARAVVDDHIADSLVALELEEVRSARDAVDLGSGAGLPGLPLAIAMPQTGYALVESAARKCAFLERAIAACGIRNARAIHSRAEGWTERLGQFELATARAVASLAVVAEYAAPLLRVGGALVVWRGQRDQADEAAAARACATLGLEPGAVRTVYPYPNARHRHLHLMLKVRDTPPVYPRRPGMALKRPLGR
jgi:16S rRNA (guanine527-N7)-methyltransferase